MKTFFLYLAFLATPLLAKLVWKEDGDMMDRVRKALEGSYEDHVYGKATVEDLGTHEPNLGGNRKMIALCKSQFPNSSNPTFSYRPLVFDAKTEAIRFCVNSAQKINLKEARASAEHYVYSRFAFTDTWECTFYYYHLLKKFPLHVPAAVDLQSAYKIKDSEVLMTCKLGDDRVGVVHVNKVRVADCLCFTIWFQAADGSCNLIHTSSFYMFISSVQQDLLKYLQVPIQFAEPWLPAAEVFSDGDASTRVSQLLSSTSVGEVTPEKAKRVRGDPSKIAAVFLEKSTKTQILALVTSTASVGGVTDFKLNHVYKSQKGDDYIESNLQKFLSQALPFTSDWKIAEANNKENKKIKSLIKEVLEKNYKDVTTCEVVRTKNVGSAYKQKAAIVYTEILDDMDKLNKRYLYVAYTEMNGNISIKQIGPLLLDLGVAMDAFDSYGISPLAFTETEFNYGAGWYGKDQTPECIKESMSAIMEDASKLKAKSVGAWVYEAGYSWLQEVGRIPTGVVLEGEQQFRLIVKRNQHESMEAIRVKFIDENYVETYED